MSVCGSLCLSVREDIPGTTCAIFTKFFVLVIVAYAVARSSSKFAIGCIAYRREGFLFPTEYALSACIIGPFAFKYQGNGTIPCQYVDTIRKRIDCDTSLPLRVLCSRLFVICCRNCPKEDKFRYFIPILRKLGAACRTLVDGSLESPCRVLVKCNRTSFSIACG